MKFTVVIPTFNRPNLLKIALQSVANQTAIGAVDRIVVSENGLNKESYNTCLLFSNINIEYVYQESQLPVSKHLQWVMSIEKDNYVAFLCDDDWWDINHLELAAHHLSRNTRCHAYFSNFIYAQDEHSIKFSVYSGLRGMHLGKENYVNYLPNIYTEKDLLNQSLMITPFHFSSLICRGDILAKAVTVLDYVHPTYADRALWPVIGNSTNVIFNPLATALVRFHDEMDSHRYSSTEWRHEAQKGSLFILEMADKKGYDIREAINHLYHNSREEDKSFITDNMNWIFIDRHNLTWFAGYKKILMQDKAQKAYKNRIKILINKFTQKVLDKAL